MNKGKFYITTAIAYTSRKPHIGNSYEIVLTDAIARYKRLQMTEAKLDDLNVSYEELLSENEDVDIGEAYIKYTEADLLYQASLSATSKVLGNSLLDFI